MDEEFDQEGGPHVAWNRLEAWRAYQRQRVLAITLGDLFLSLAQAFVELSPAAKRRDNCRRAAGLLVRSAAQYQDGGLTHRAQVVWRLARFMHRAAWVAT